MKLRMLLVAAAIVGAASPSFAGCIGAEIMGVCHGMQTGSSARSGQVEMDGYGPGVGRDQYGGAFTHEPYQAIQPNAYGLGMGMDQYGRAVPHDPMWR